MRSRVNEGLAASALAYQLEEEYRMYERGSGPARGGGLGRRVVDGISFDVTHVYRDRSSGLTAFRAVTHEGRVVYGVAGTNVRGREFVTDALNWVGVGRTAYDPEAGRRLLRDAIQDRRAGLSLHVAGHSLGGGVSQLIALDVVKEFGVRGLELTTFAAPGMFGVVSKPTAEEQILSRNVDALNFQGLTDVVPYVGFQFGRRVLVKPEAEEGGMAFFSAHGLTSYARSIQDEDIPKDERRPVENEAGGRVGTTRQGGRRSDLLVPDWERRVRGDLARILYYADAPASPDDRETGEADGLNMYIAGPGRTSAYGWKYDRRGRAKAAGTDGEVKVKAHTREGHPVAAHTRSRPDRG